MFIGELLNLFSHFHDHDCPNENEVVFEIPWEFLPLAKFRSSCKHTHMAYY